MTALTDDYLNEIEARLNDGKITNIELLCHFANDVPALLAEVRRLQYDLKLRDMFAASDKNIMEAMISVMNQHGIDYASIVQRVQQRMKGAAE